MNKYPATASYNLIYIYTIHDEAHAGLLKIGKASLSSMLSEKQLPPNCDVLNAAARRRIDQQTRTALVEYELLHTELAVRHMEMADGSRYTQTFVDDDVHEVLLNASVQLIRFKDSGKDSEWAKVDLQTAIKAIKAVKNGHSFLTTDNETPPPIKNHPKITLRKEQEENVEKTLSVFQTKDTMLWDCKMRYGKTVTAYELIRRAEYQKVIVITHRPAVEDGWRKDHDLIFAGTNHFFKIKENGSNDDFDAVMDAKNDRELQELISSKVPFVYFASIQDLRGSKRVKGKFNKNNGVFDTEWDLVIVDEAHEGTQTDLGDAVVNALCKDGTKKLSLSGTPYNILGEYEDNVFTWTYTDEQRAKREWAEKHPDEKNPYADLPTMNILTFDLAGQLAHSYRYVTEEAAFNFREFFRVWTGDAEKDFRPVPAGQKIGDFVHEADVRAFLDLITKNDEESNYPFASEEYRDMFRHTFWLVPGVKEAKALSSMLKAHPVFGGFSIANIAGDGDEEQPYDAALKLVRDNIANHPYTIAISCGKLTTGITVPEWTGIMMLSGSSSTSVSGYMQAIFRVQSPGCINGKQKENCYVFDFAPDRTLRVLATVHNLSPKHTSEGGKNALGEFLNFCPVLAIEGTAMRAYDVPELMRQIKRASIDSAIKSGFEDDIIYKSDVGIVMDSFDAKILNMLSDVLVPQKKRGNQKEFTVNEQGLTHEEYDRAERAKAKPKRQRTLEEQELIEKANKQKEEQRRTRDLLRAVSIRLPLLFYGAKADITEIIHLQDFVEIVDDESWEEFMPRGLKKSLFLEMLRFYDEDVLVEAGLRIRKISKAADELPPTLRAEKIVGILGGFKNPDKETVLTPWRVVNMHLGDCIGGYNFYNERYTKEIPEPRLIEQGDVTANIFLNPETRILEMNSKSGLYPLYMTYSIYMLKVDGNESKIPFEKAQQLWFETIRENIFVLCKTKMAQLITIRTLAGYTGKPVNAIFLTKLLDRMQDKDRFTRKLTNPATWGRTGERMKFDAIVGNPPYQLQTEGSVESQAVPIYNKFVEQAQMLQPQYMTMIIPARWLNGGFGLDSFRMSMLKSKQISDMHIYMDSTDCFPGVDISGGTCYFLWETEISEQCLVVNHQEGKTNKVMRPLLEPGLEIFIRENQAVSIISKVKAFEEESFEELVTAADPFGLNYKDGNTVKMFKKYYPEKKADDDVGIYYYGWLKDGVSYTSRNYITSNNEAVDKYKVFISKAYGERGIYPYFIIGKPFLAPPNTICNMTYIMVGSYDNEQTAKNVISYMNTKFFRFLVSLLKSTQNAYKKVYKLVPVQDFTKTWTDAELYAKYGLSAEEISFIESMIKPME